MAAVRKYTMGTDSEPLFAEVSPGSPEDYSITLSELSESDLLKWRNGGFLDKEQESYTLYEFMNTGCDYHKIMGYLHGDKALVWLRLFEYLAKKYPTLNELTFHFYCLDEKEPFYLSWKRENILTHNNLQIHVGSNESIYWFIDDPNSKQDKYNRLVFKKDMYVKNWRKASFRTFYASTQGIF